MRRGQTYSTMLVDLLRHQPINVIECREAGPLDQWLKDHPGISVLARDRSEAYAPARRGGAPNSIQVADRFHLVKNANDLLNELLRSSHWKIPETESGLLGDSSQMGPPEAKSHAEQIQSSTVKSHLWEEARERKNRGQSIRAISRELRIHRATVSRYMEARSPPVYRRALTRTTKLNSHMKYILQ